MGVLTDLKNRIDTIVDSTSISKVVYDRIESINTIKRADYPLVIWRVTNTTTETFKKNNRYETMTIDFFISDLFEQREISTLVEKKDYLVDLVNQLVRSIPDTYNSFELAQNSSAEFGWEEHDANLIVIKRTATIRAFICES